MEGTEKTSTSLLRKATLLSLSLGLVLAASATMTGCATAEGGGGKIGPDYWGSGAYQGARTQQMHSEIQRGNF